MQQQSHSGNVASRKTDNGPIHLGNSCCLSHADSHSDLLSVTKGRYLCSAPPPQQFTGESYEGIATYTTQNVSVWDMSANTTIDISNAVQPTYLTSLNMNTYTLRTDDTVYDKTCDNKRQTAIENIDISMGVALSGVNSASQNQLQTAFNNADRLSGFTYPHRFLGNSLPKPCKQ
jgi:hypothetical protein